MIRRLSRPYLSPAAKQQRKEAAQAWYDRQKPISRSDNQSTEPPCSSRASVGRPLGEAMDRSGANSN
jgi:hypothetical protein